MRELVDRLERFPLVLAALCGRVGSEAARWRARPDSWSLLEIVAHLEEEERRDFRVRIERTLRDPREPWPPIDPQAWVRDHAYQERDLNEVLRQFALERQSSVFWLRELPAPDWSAVHEHATLGPLRAGDLLVSWCAHDALHLRQLARWTYERTLADAAPYRADYAGPWT